VGTVRDTSIATYHRIKEEGLLGKRQLQVYEVLFAKGPLTGDVVLSLVKGTYGEWGHPETVRNRLTELRGKGVVAEVGTAVSPLNGRHVILWDVTSKLPKKPEKKKTRSEIKIEALRYVTKIQRNIMNPKERLTRAMMYEVLDVIKEKVSEL
jgi:hypothetical protein